MSVADVAAFQRERADTIDLIDRLLVATARATPQFGCFGLHEWAMVYEQSPSERRHSTVPLRLGPDATAAVVRAHPLKCTHFDAFRFFTAAAKPLNATQPTVWSRVDSDQPGCLHATMDLYKWAYKLLPVVSSELVVDCFRLARDVRTMDMQASPYDLTDWGLTPVAVETPDGKAAYVAAQRSFAHRGAALRLRLLAAMAPLRVEAARTRPQPAEDPPS